MNPITMRVYELVQDLPRMMWPYKADHLPMNGVYLFFERGELGEFGGRLMDRIVRVGTHNKDGRFPMRIHQHYGRAKSFRGNKNGSVFRKHLGGALLRRNDPQDLRLSDWLTQDGPSFIEVEELVTKYLRDNMSFVCVPVESAIHRSNLEVGLVALLAQFPVFAPTPEWIGNHAQSEKIRKHGIWNVHYVNKTPLAEEDLSLLGLSLALASDIFIGAVN